MTSSVEAHVWAVVPAAGTGRRMGADTPKQYLELLGRPVIRWTLEALLGHPRVQGAVVAIGEQDRHWPTVELPSGKAVHTVRGGDERCHSVHNALQLLRSAGDPDTWVLVHDAVRPCVRLDELDRLLEKGLAHPDGALLATPVRDTLKRQDTDGRAAETVDRNGVWHAMTPQLFPLEALLSALDRSLRDGVRITDEAQAMERAGSSPLLVEGEATNIKVTRPADLVLAEAILGSWSGGVHR